MKGSEYICRGRRRQRWGGTAHEAHLRGHPERHEVVLVHGQGPHADGGARLGGLLDLLRGEVRVGLEGLDLLGGGGGDRTCPGNRALLLPMHMRQKSSHRCSTSPDGGRKSGASSPALLAKSWRAVCTCWLAVILVHGNLSSFSRREDSQHFRNAIDMPRRAFPFAYRCL